MRELFGLIMTLLVAATATGAAPLASTRRAMPLELRAMTFNIRFGTAADGPNAWTHRGGAVIDLIDRADMDVIGLQEALRFQIDEIRTALPRYAEIGVGRTDGLTGGEYSAILYRHDRYAVAAAGTFWLSDTPAEPGSRSWGNDIPRICTWARLVDTRTGRGFYVFNTHWDHRSQPSRERAAELIAARIGAREHDEPVVLMGDLNAGEDNAGVTYLLGERASASGRDDAPPSPGLVDTLRAVHPDAEPVGTYTGFALSSVLGPKIDHVLATPDATVVDAGIDRTRIGDRYPSDHFPVWAHLRWEAP